MSDSERSQKVTKQSRAEMRRRAVSEGVIEGKTEKQMAGELGITRERVARIKADSRVQKRIRERAAETASLMPDEVIGTLAAQMRADVTDLFDSHNSFDLKAIRRKKLGHLIKKIKVQRRVIGAGENAEPVKIIELELHNQQAAAIQLCKVLGIEKLPAPNDASRWHEIAAYLAEKYNKPLDEVVRDLANRKPELASLLIQ